MLKISIITDNAFFRLGICALIKEGVYIVNKKEECEFTEKVDLEHSDLIVTQCRHGAEAVVVNALQLGGKQQAFVFLEKRDIRKRYLGGAQWQYQCFMMDDPVHKFVKSFTLYLRQRRYKRLGNEMLRTCGLLTEREWNFIHLYCSGISLQRVGKNMGFSDKYASHIKRNIMKKLHLRHDSFLISFYREYRRHYGEANSLQ